MTQVNHRSAFYSYIWPTAPLAVGFDEACAMCQKFRWLAEKTMGPSSGVTMDSAQRPKNVALRAVSPEARLATLHAADGDKVVHGFSAVSALARRSLVGPVVAPLIAAFEFSPVGEAIYKRVNRYRMCHKGCCERPPT